jgi:cytochrome P450
MIRSPGSRPAVPGTLTYDPLDFDTHCDPYPTYRRLRAEQPLYWNAERSFWALSRHDDVARAARDWQRYSSGPGGERSEMDRYFGIRPVDYVAADSERHSVVRGLLRRDFAASGVARLQRAIREIATDLVDQLAESRRADFVEALAQPLPAAVLCRLLGFPPEAAESIRRWNRELWRRAPDDIALPDTLLAADREAREYVDAAASDRSARGVMRTLREAERSQAISHEELLDIGVLLIAAGTKTTSALIAIALQLLAQHPDQQRQVAADPDLIAGAVEEVLRFDSPAQWFARVTTTDVETDHGTIPAGERVLLLFGSANRDEREHADAHRFDVRRSAPRHLSFGHGIHHCLAASLARLEARVCLEVVLSRLRGLECAGEAQRAYTPAERDLANLPLSYEVA